MENIIKRTKKTRPKTKRFINKVARIERLRIQTRKWEEFIRFNRKSGTLLGFCSLFGYE